MMILQMVVSEVSVVQTNCVKFTDKLIEFSWLMDKFVSNNKMNCVHIRDDKDKGDEAG